MFALHQGPKTYVRYTALYTSERSSSLCYQEHFPFYPFSRHQIQLPPDMAGPTSEGTGRRNQETGADAVWMRSDTYSRGLNWDSTVQLNLFCLATTGILKT